MTSPAATAVLPEALPAASGTVMANALRVLAMDAVEAANSGHPGMPMGMADVATVLFSKFVKLNPAVPTWPDRDRFVLSAGHGSMLLYGLNHLLGYERMTLEELKRFRQLGSLTAGHPEVDPEAGIETTTGPLGQGLATAVGMALAERIVNARFGDDLVDHRTWVIASDGDLQEGVSHEAASLAGHLQLSKLVVLWDDNRISIDGPTDLSFTDDTLKRFEAYGWTTASVAGHDQDAIAAAIEAALPSDKPVLISCRTTIGYGAPTKSNSAGCHGSPLGMTEIAGARVALSWEHEPWLIPDAVRDAWSRAGRRSLDAYDAWTARLDSADASQRDAFLHALSGDLPADFAERIAAYKATVLAERPKIATRASSGKTLDMLLPFVHEMIGGSADLTGSNNTYVKALGAVKGRGDFHGRYIHYGVREHGMAAAMNGMALHGGLIPYSGTFLTFSDYSRPALRLAALMHTRAIHVLTHDSIGLGEDGPTHQPVEHLAALRAIPNLLVFRPADAVEAAEAWALALAERNRPSMMVLTRQNLPVLRDGAEDPALNRSARGAYLLREPQDGPRQATLIATGSEVEIAVQAAEMLAEKHGIRAAVVSVPCMDLFLEQPEDWQDSLLGDGPRVAIEAAVRFGWDALLRRGDRFIGMKGFGASGPYQELYKHFGITADAAVQAVVERV